MSTFVLRVSSGFTQNIVCGGSIGFRGGIGDATERVAISFLREVNEECSSKETDGVVSHGLLI
jgi:hypothetical protein